MKKNNNLHKKIWIIHFGMIFLFVGSCGLFYILKSASETTHTSFQESNNTHNTDSLPDIFTDEIADNRLDAYNKATAIIQQEQKEKELQEEHNSFLFFTEKSEEIIAEKEVNKEDTNRNALQNFKQSIVEYTPKKEPISKKRTSKTEPVDTEIKNYDDIDLTEAKEKEKKERFERLRSLYINPPKEEIQEPKERNIVQSKEEKPIVQQPKNGFRPINSTTKKNNNGRIKAVIHGEQKNITSSSQVKLRILEPIIIDGTSIPENTIVIGMANFNKNRVNIHIENIVYKDNVYPFKGTIYDKDGFEGIYFPENLVNDVQKEAGSETITDTEINLGNVTGILNTGAHAIINATKSVVNGSVKDVKVTLASNYNLIIKIDE